MEQADKEDIHYPLGRHPLASSRLTLQHFLVKKTLGFNLAPSIELPASPKIADIATGNAIWLLEVAETLPSTATLDGFDISLSQAPPKEWLPSNVNLYDWDIHKEPPKQFHGIYDVVHLRFMSFVIDPNNPSKDLANIKMLLKPGGYLQWEDYDNRFSWIAKARPGLETPALDRLLRLMANPSSTPDKDIPKTNTYKWRDELPSKLEAVGFKGVTRKLYQDFYEENHSLAKFYSDQTLFTCEEFAHLNFGKSPATKWIHDTLAAATVETAKGAAVILPLCIFMARNGN